MLNLTTVTLPSWLKRASAIAGLLLLLPGLPLTFGFFCITRMLAVEGDHDAISAGLISFTLTAITLGAGRIVVWHSLRSLQGKNQKR